MRSKIVTRIGILGALGVLTLMSAPLGIQAATTTSSLRLTGLTGPSDTRTFPATWFNYSIENTGEIAGGGGGGAGKATFAPLVVRHALRPAQSLIFKAAAEGRILPEARLIVKQGDNTIVVITLEDALISHAMVSGKGGSPQTTLKYRKVTVTTKGSTFCYDVGLNVSC